MRLTGEQAQVRETVRRFADEAIHPLAGETFFQTGLFRDPEDHP